jgi:hypothetical protein
VRRISRLNKVVLGILARVSVAGPPFVARELSRHVRRLFWGAGMRRTAILWEAFVSRSEDAFEQYQRWRKTAEDAGELLGMSGRNFRRLVVRYRQSVRRGVRRRGSLSGCSVPCRSGCRRNWRPAAIKTLAAANRYIKERFVPDYNARFAVPYGPSPGRPSCHMRGGGSTSSRVASPLKSAQRPWRLWVCGQRKDALPTSPRGATTAASSAHM